MTLTTTSTMEATTLTTTMAMTRADINSQPTTMGEEPHQQQLLTITTEEPIIKIRYKQTTITIMIMEALPHSSQARTTTTGTITTHRKQVAYRTTTTKRSSTLRKRRTTIVTSNLEKTTP